MVSLLCFVAAYVLWLLIPGPQGSRKQQRRRFCRLYSGIIVVFCGLPGPQKELISAKDLGFKMDSLTRGNERMCRNKGCVGKLQEIKNGY